MAAEMCLEQYLAYLRQNCLLGIDHQNQRPLLSKILHYVANLVVRLADCGPIFYFDRQEPVIDQSFAESRNRDNRYGRQGKADRFPSGRG